MVSERTQKEHLIMNKMLQNFKDEFKNREDVKIKIVTLV